MRKEIYNIHKFEYDTYEKLIKDIYVLQNEGFAIDYAELTDNYTYILQAKKVNDIMVKNGDCNPTYTVYGENFITLREGINDIQEIYNKNKNNMNKEELKEFCYKIENNIKDKDKRLLQVLSDKEIFDLIDIALDRGDNDRVRELSKYIGLSGND